MGGPGLWDNNGGVGRGLFWHYPYSKEQCYLLEALTGKYLHHPFAQVNSIRPLLIIIMIITNKKAQEDEQIHPIPKTCWDLGSHFYINSARCIWDVIVGIFFLLTDWMLVCYMVTALQLIYYCRCTGDVSKRQQETNFWNQFRECKILAKERGNCLINILKWRSIFWSCSLRYLLPFCVLINNKTFTFNKTTKE